jgi:arylsulfatase A-like enzyme
VNRRTFLASPATPLLAQATRPPNIVFLISDDHSAPDLGCYGNPGIRTPNLDRLAAEGMRFQRCFVSSPQCSPNRSSILTGATPHTTSTSRLHTPMPDWEPTVIDRLKDRGYFTGAYRKVHQGPSFDRRWNFYAKAGEPLARFFDERPKDRPFFLHFGSTDPHRPYRDGAFDPPTRPQDVRVPKFLPDSPEIRVDLAHYSDYISRFDRECGEILGLLDRHGLRDDTVVFVTGDNGMPFPRAKGTLYEPGINVPLIARWPNRIQAGGVAGEMIAHVDLPATWLELAGAAALPKMQGRSFLPRLTGAAYTPRTEIFSERNWHDTYDPSRCIRTGRYKLIWNATPAKPYWPIRDLADSRTWASYLQLDRQGKLAPEHRLLMRPTRPDYELYDLEADAAEFFNRADDPALRETLDDLRRRLGDWMAQTFDHLPPVPRSAPV